MRVEGLQRSGASANLNMGMVATWLTLLGNVHTLKILASTVQNKLATNADLFKDRLICTTTFGALHAMMHISTKTLAGTSAPAVQAIAKSELGLRCSVPFIRQWVKGMQRLSSQYFDTLVGVFANKVEAAASTLERLMPRWQSYVNDTVFNEELAMKKILSNPDRASIKDARTCLQSLVDTLEHVFKTLQFRPSFSEHKLSKSASAFAAATLQDALQFTCVTAGLSAVIRFSKAAHGPKMAKDTLDIASRNNIELPRMLRRMLQVLAREEGAMEVSSSAKHESSSASPAKTELAAAQASSSTASAVVAATPHAAPAALKRRRTSKGGELVKKDYESMLEGRMSGRVVPRSKAEAKSAQDESPPVAVNVPRGSLARVKCEESSSIQHSRQEDASTPPSGGE